MTGYRLAEMLLQQLKDDPEIRRSLPMGVDLADPDVLAEHLRLVADRMAMPPSEPESILDRAAGLLGADLRPATRPAPLEPLAQLAFALSWIPTARVRPAARPAVRAERQRLQHHRSRQDGDAAGSAGARRRECCWTALSTRPPS